MSGDGDLVFVGDVHLDRNDDDLPAFLAYLRGLTTGARRIVLMGDLFNLWIAEPGLEQAHHHAVTTCLAELRAGGVEVHYLEGNRDYRVARYHRGRTFDAVSDVGLWEEWGGRKIWAAHGDLVNVEDRRYRAWRRLSRSSAAWWLFSAVPRHRRVGLAESLERSMRGTNLEMKAAFPEAVARAYAAPRFAVGADAVVLGHFHVERDVHAHGGAGGRICVLPEWKGSRRHLRVTGAGEIRFEDA